MEAEKADRIIRAGRLVLDLNRAALQVDGEDVPLRPQSFDVLRVLIAHRGSLVSKQQLLDEVWGDLAVTDDSISQCLGDIRRALDDTEKKIVRTVPRRGYIFEDDLVLSDSNISNREEGLSGVRITAIAAIVVLLAAAVFAYLDSGNSGSMENAPPVIAVLPFADMTAAQDKRFLAEGLSEEILNALSDSSDLRVIGRISSFSFSANNADIREIGEELGATHVLQGSVRQSDDRLRISAQLVAAPDGTQLWARSFDRPFGNILDIQTQIASSVADTLRIAFELDSFPTRVVDPYVYALVIEARSLIRSIEEKSFERASHLLDQAIEIDPDYVPALLTKSLVLYNAFDRGTNEAFEAEKSSISLVDRALELSPDNAQANAYRGWLEMHHFKNFEQAARYYERATSLDPFDLDVLQSTMNATVVLNRPDLGVALGQYVVDRDPLCEACFTYLSLAARISGNHETAIQAIQQVLKFNPASKFAWLNLGNALYVSGDPVTALEALDKQEFETGNLLRLKALAHYALGNLESFARNRTQLIEKYGDDDPLLIAYVEAVRGDRDAAFAWLDKNAALPKWRRSLGGFKQAEFEFLHDDPRWQAYLNAMGWSEVEMGKINFNPTLPL